MLEFFSSEKPFENESNVKIAVIESNKNCLYMELFI